MGHSVEPVDVDPAKRLVDYTRIAISAGIASVPIKNPDAMDPVVRRAWEAGQGVSPATDYLGAVARMHNTSREIVQALAPYDATLAPTLPSAAPRLGLPTEKFEEQLYPFIQFTFPFNATGQPAFSLPNGFTRCRTADRFADNRPARRRTRHHRARGGFRAGAALARSTSRPLDR